VREKLAELIPKLGSDRQQSKRPPRAFRITLQL
jgi:hypothetical protein